MVHFAESVVHCEDFPYLVQRKRSQTTEVFPLRQVDRGHMILVHPGTQAIAHSAVEVHPERKQRAYEGAMFHSVFLVEAHHLQSYALLFMKRMHSESHETYCLFHLSVDVHAEAHQLHGGHKFSILEAAVEVHVVIQFHVPDVFCFIFFVAVFVQVFESRIGVQIYIHVFVHDLRTDLSYLSHVFILA